MAAWSNWSASVQAAPRKIARPETLQALQRRVVEADKVRVAGAGHSFMPLCETDGLLLDLSALEGDIEVAPDRKTAWAPAGWSLKRLTRALWDLGLSLPNQGDVNPQALAGALATGTHGTGRDLGSLSTFAHAYRLVLADGSAVEVDRGRDPELFEAQRLALGLLGVVTAARIDVLPAFKLEERIVKRPLAEVMETFDALAASHRHVEFFVFPYADQAILKTLHPIEAEDTPRPAKPSNEEAIFQALCDLGARAPVLIPSLQRIMTRAASPQHRIGPAWRVFPSERNVRFEEMEYEVPRAAGLEALKAVTDWIRRRRLPVAFPFEFRWCAGDDIWLSPFNRGPGASVSMHQYAPMPWRELFAEAEAIFRDHGGRPHWAKRHTLSRAEVDALYPAAERFRAQRRRVDPSGKFLNGHLAALFE